MRNTHYRLRDWLGNLPILNKTMLLFGLLVLMPMLAVNTSLLVTSTQQLRNQFELDMEREMGQDCRAMENALAQVQFCTQSFQVDDGLLAYVEYEDFSSAVGGYDYMVYVRPAFEKINSLYSSFKKVTIYRASPRPLNPLFYVANIENPKLEYYLDHLIRKQMVMVVNNNGDVPLLDIYTPLYNNTFTRKIGLVEIECSLESILGVLYDKDTSDTDTLFVVIDGKLYSLSFVSNGQAEIVPLEILPEYSGNVLDFSIDPPGITVIRYYESPRTLSNVMIARILLGLLILLIVFTLFYYEMFAMITRRITGLTAYMKRLQTDRSTLVYTDPFHDEIGTMNHMFNSTMVKTYQILDDQTQQERLTSQARYYALASQIRPHFIFNTLQNIDMLIEIGQYEKAQQMITLFSRIMRFNLGENREISTISEDAEQARNYLELYAYRVSEDFHYEVLIADEIRERPCPYIMLQPLIENCFKHGYREKDEKEAFHIAIRGHDEQGDTVVTVEDNGIGVTEEKLQEIADRLNGIIPDRNEASSSTGSSFSIGLLNVHERIRMLFGEGSGLRVSRGAEGGCLVIIRIKSLGEDWNEYINR